MNSGKTNTLKILTPDGVAFSFELASPVARFLAWSVDLASIMAITSALNIVLGLVVTISPDLGSAVAMASAFLVQTGYSMALEWFWRGQTLGKRLLSLRVMDAEGLRLHGSQIVIRNLVRFIDFLPAFYMVGGASCLLSSKAQRLGDLAANTIVVRSRKVKQPDLEQLLAGKYNSLKECSHLAARLRQQVSPQEAALALEALMRRDELDPQSRVTLFEEMAEHFKALVTFPQTATDGITAEQYVRNVVDVLYTKTK